MVSRMGKKIRRIERINRREKAKMDKYVLSMLIDVANGGDKNRGKRGVENKNFQTHYPNMDSPNWGKYHGREVDLAFIKMRPQLGEILEGLMIEIRDMEMEEKGVEISYLEMGEEEAVVETDHITILGEGMIMRIEELRDLEVLVETKEDSSIRKEWRADLRLLALDREEGNQIITKKRVIMGSRVRGRKFLYHLPRISPRFCLWALDWDKWGSYHLNRWRIIISTC